MTPQTKTRSPGKVSAHNQIKHFSSIISRKNIFDDRPTGICTDCGWVFVREGKGEGEGEGVCASCFKSVVF